MVVRACQRCAMTASVHRPPVYVANYGQRPRPCPDAGRPGRAYRRVDHSDLEEGPVSKLIVGVDGSDRSDDALALASSLARRTAAEIVLARAYPFDDAAVHLGDSTRRHHLREEAQRILDRLRERANTTLRFTTRTIADPSPSRALHTLAE